MACFKSLKYETKSDEEKKQIEDNLLMKLGKWKYSPYELSQKILDELLNAIKPRWDSVIKTAKDIYEQTLRQLIPSLNEKQVKESLKKNEKKLTLKFNTCLIFLKDIESSVQSTSTTWKNIYGLHKPNDFVMHVNDKDGEDEA